MLTETLHTIMLRFQTPLHNQVHRNLAGIFASLEELIKTKKRDTFSADVQEFIYSSPGIFCEKIHGHLKDLYKYIDFEEVCLRNWEDISSLLENLLLAIKANSTEYRELQSWYKKRNAKKKNIATRQILLNYLKNFYDVLCIIFNMYKWDALCGSLKNALKIEEEALAQNSAQNFA